MMERIDNTHNRKLWLFSLLKLASDELGPDVTWSYLVNVAKQYGNSAVDKPTTAEFDSLADATVRDLFAGAEH